MSARDLRIAINAENPWPGLLSFPEDASRYFHGRDTDADELVRLVKREPLSVLFGQSGLGKTSLLNAGLFPRLRKNDYLPIYLRLDTSPNSPSFVEQVKSVLGTSLRTQQVDAPLPSPAESLWEYFHRRDTDLWSPRNRLLVPVLVFDQFEEIFTTGQRSDATRGQAEAILEELANLVENRVPAAVAAGLELDPDRAARLDFSRQDYRILLSFREDFLPEFEGLRKLIPSIMQNRMRLTRMSGLQALEVVAQGGSTLVEEGVAARIVRFVSGDRKYMEGDEEVDLARLEIEPALLSVVCRELNTKRQDEGIARISARLLTGAHRAIIDDFYNRSVEDLDPNMRIFVENQLITEAGYRDSYALDDALRLPGVTREAVDALVSRRLLRLEERFGSLRIELTHDVLTGVIKEARDTRKAAEERIENAVRIKKQRRRTRQVMSGAVFMGVLAVAFAALAFQATSEKSRAVRAQSNALFGQALLELDNQEPHNALRSLARAIELNPDNTAAVARTATLLTQRQFVAGLESQRSSGKMWAVAISSDGSRIATASHDGKVRVIDPEAASGKRLVLNVGGRLSSVAFSPAGDYLAAGSDQGLAQLWYFYPNRDRRDSAGEGFWELAAALPHAGVVNSVAFSPDGQYVVTGSSDASARIWPVLRADNLLPVFTLSHAGPVNNAIFNKRGDRVITIADDNTARVWELASGRQLFSLPHAAAVKAVAVSDDDRLIATGSSDGKVQVWDGEGGARITQVTHEGAVNSVEFSPDGSLLVSASSDQTARLWYARSGISFGQPLRHRGVVLAAHFDPDGRRIATTSWDGTAKVWDVGSNDHHEVVAPLVHDGQVLSARFFLTGELLFTTTSTGKLLLWDINEKSSRLVSRNADFTSKGLFSPDGRHVATLHHDATSSHIKLWNVNERKLEFRLGPSVSRISTMLFSPDGRRLIAGEENGTIQQWQLDTGKLVGDPVTHPASVLKIVSEPRGQTIAAGYADGIAMLWDTGTGKPAIPPLRHGGAVHLLQFNADGTRLATASRDGVARVWDVASGIPYTRPLQHAGRINDISFSPDGRSLLTAGENGKALVWSALYTENNEAGELPHPGIVFSARYSPDGRHIVTSCIDGVARVWDSQTRRATGIELKHSNVVLSATYNRDGRWLLTTSFDRSVQLWDAASGAPVADRLAYEDVLDAVDLGSDANNLLVVSGGNAELRQLSLNLPTGMPAWLPALARAVAIDPGIEKIRKFVREGGLQKGGALPSWYSEMMQGDSGKQDRRDADSRQSSDWLAGTRLSELLGEETGRSGQDASPVSIRADAAAASLVANWYAGVAPAGNADWVAWANRILQDNFPRDSREENKK